MLVECTKKPSYSEYVETAVTVGKQYTVLNKDNNDYLLIDDNGKERYYQLEHFKEIMKTEERKKEDCELIDKYNSFLIMQGSRITFDTGALQEFKKDNDLLPKEQPNELLEKVNRLETELKELKTLIKKK